MRTFNYEFEELPLVVAPGIEAALINGLAEIGFGESGWQINGVYVEGYKRITLEERAAGVKPWVYLPAPAALDHLIVGRLHHEWRDKVEEAVAHEIARDRENAAEDAADMRREHLRESI